MSKIGTLIVSLDFELNWGVHDVFTIEQYGDNILGARQAIPEMLALFKQYQIHATWATVGMLCFDDKKEMQKQIPPLLPTYVNQEFSPYSKLSSVGENEERDPFHFGLSLVRQIMQVPHQEIGTHTFSHYYCLEYGQTAEQFLADLKASMSIPILRSHEIHSLVFPRNQINYHYLSLSKDLGIKSYRGNEKNWAYEASGHKDRSKVGRIIRLLDSYINLTGHHTYTIEEDDPNYPINLRSSRFLRPFQPKLKILEPLRLKRIKKGIEHAAKYGKTYHLWWHPHNFGTHLEENMCFLVEILAFADEMRQAYGLRSLNMGEAASLIKYNNHQNVD